MPFQAFLNYTEGFASQLAAPMATLKHLPRDRIFHQIFITHAATIFELKDSTILKVSSQGQKHGREFFGLKCYLIYLI